MCSFLLFPAFVDMGVDKRYSTVPGRADTLLTRR
jgi:hypothetical protein